MISIDVKMSLQFGCSFKETATKVQPMFLHLLIDVGIQRILKRTRETERNRERDLSLAILYLKSRGGKVGSSGKDAPWPAERLSSF